MFVELSDVLERLHSCVDQQQGHMASCGLLNSLSEAEEIEEEVGASTGPDHELLQRLARRAQLWPVLEELAILNQMKVTADLLHQSIIHRYEFSCRFYFPCPVSCPVCFIGCGHLFLIIVSFLTSSASPYVPQRE